MIIIGVIFLLSILCFLFVDIEMSIEILQARKKPKTNHYLI